MRIAPLLFMLAFPLIAGAQDIGAVFAIFLGIFDILVLVIISFALILFIWGVVKFMANSESQDARTEGKNFMIWGIVALFVMISVWGLVGVLQETFNITETSSTVFVEWIYQ